MARKRKRKKTQPEKISGVQMFIHSLQAMGGAGEHRRKRSKAGRRKNNCRNIDRRKGGFDD